VTRLGKRYVAIVEHPTMPHWDDYPAPGMHKTEAAAVAVKDDVVLHACGCDYEHAGHVLCVDLDLAAPVSATDEQLAMHWERVELHAAEKRAQYWPALRGEPVKVDERSEADGDNDPTWIEALGTVARLARWALNEAGTHAKPGQEAAVRFAEAEVRRMRKAGAP
jgi:hypothetical protein